MDSEKQTDTREPLFQEESEKLSSIHKAVVDALQKAKLPVVPAAARIGLDNLTVANMCLQQLSFLLLHGDELRAQAADEAVEQKFGGVLNDPK